MTKEEEIEEELKKIGTTGTKLFREFCEKYGQGPWYVPGWDEYAAISDAKTLITSASMITCRSLLGEANEHKANHDRKMSYADQIQSAKDRG
jgi:hypothetical protein